MPEGTARPNAVHGWSLLWDGGGQECSFSYLPDGWQWLPKPAESAPEPPPEMIEKDAEIRRLHRRDWHRELRKGVMALCGFDAHEIADTEQGVGILLSSISNRIEDSQAKALHFSRELDRVQRELAATGRIAPSGELLARVEARLLALLPEEIEPLTDSAASLVRLYFEMHAALSGGGR